MKFKLFAVAAVSAFALAACSPAETVTTQPAAVEEPVVEPVADEPVALGTVVDIAAGNPDFSTLVAAIQAAGLAETLSGPGPFTVFAPTNAAFAALPAGTLDSLLLPENKDQLTKILTYHVVSGKVMAADLPAADAGVATSTVAGLDLSVRVEADGTAKANEATITAANIEASNGVIHVIDTVLVPRMEE
ncbi:MAG: fasciclin domain-containing protein [Hyphomonas sp.]|nr:fasciclin domain-containing protein [Hyphomonas sp.]MDP3458972.1 fasciclin domain-containing protein [Hyphomonas sp.]